MKKINYLSMFALTASAAMLLPSCSNDDIDIQTGDATVTLTATLPASLQTRAFGDGTTAKNLQMVVCEAGDSGIKGGNLAVFDDGTKTVYTTAFAGNSLTTNVPVKLVTGKTYAVICWSDAGAASPYTFNATDHSVDAKYEGFTTSDENLDAFYAYQTFTVEGDGTQTIQLRRPFAQLNIGTDDLAAAKAAGFTAATAEVTVSVSDHLDLVTGEVNKPKPIAFAAKALPEGETFPTSAGTSYDYLAMNYVLTGADKSLVDVNLTVTGNGAPISHTFNTVPVQRNYRTNIFGSILTNAVNVQVEIVPDFDGSYGYAADVYKMVADLSAGKNVALVKDLEPTQMMEITGGHTVSLNLNGKTVANKETIWDESGNALLSLEDGTTLTINGNGTLKPKAEDCYGINVKGGSHLIIEDGHFYGNVSVIQVQEGTAEIKGGTFELLQHWNPDAYFLNCIDAAYKEGKAHIIVTGGKFIGFNPADCAAEGAHTNFVAPGYVSVKTSSSPETYEVMKSDNAMSSILKNPVDYTIPIVDTHLSSKTTSTLTLAAGGEIKGGFSEKKVQETIFIGSGTLTINGEGGRVSARTIGTTWTSAITVQGGNLVINGNNTFDGGSGSTGNYAVKLVSGSLTINGGYFHSGLDVSGKTSSEVIYLAPGYNKYVKLYINGGVFECDGDATYLINLYDSDRKRCTVEITGGTFVGFDPSHVNEGDITSFVKAGYKSVETTYNGKKAWTVVKE